jgi:predicted O-methyltransferase YrrM
MNNRELSELAINIYGAMQKQDELQSLLDFLSGHSVETVLEIGTGRGGTLWMWSHMRGNKTVVSVDMPGGEFGGGPSDDDKARIENWIDPTQETVLVSGDSHSELILAEVTEVLAGREVDLLFIDGDHSYHGVKQDFEMYFPLVKRGGVIVLHDIADHSSTCPGCTVDRFWSELKASERYTCTEIICEPKTWAGLGVITL